MQINLDQIRDHAEQRLAALPPTTAEAIESFKRFLKLETDRLRMRHRFGLGGREIAQGRSYLADVVVSRACQIAAADLGPMLKDDLSGCAVVALGGYGRRELAPFSDVDILFLHPDRLSPAVKTFVEKALLLLWDIGLSVGHSFRSVGECLSIAASDLPSRNAMSEARLVAGNGGLYQRLVSELDEAVYANKRRGEAFLAEMRGELEERLARFGGAVCIQEPNVKESAGGLRDLHTVCWIGHARFGQKGIDQLLAAGYMNPAEHATAKKAYDFIARVRNEAHFATGRRTDLLTLDLQGVVAAGLGYSSKPGAVASEIFMRDYYRRAQDLRRLCENFLFRAGATAVQQKRFVRPRVVGPRGRYEVRSSLLFPRSRTPSVSSPPRLLEIFEVAQEQGVRLSDELRLLVQGNLRSVDRRFRSARDTSRAFLSFLRRPGQIAAAVRPMHETGFLGRMIPEFERVTFLVQHDFYHRYTVDEHTLKALEALDDIETAKHPEGTAAFANVLKTIKDPAILALGILFHDIGKGRGVSHSPRGAKIAEAICRRLGLDAQLTEDVSFLVQKHLVMSHVSQRRDLSDQALIEGFAETVKSMDRLNMLLLLTYADTTAVGPGVWNDWKAALLWELYSKTRAQLSGEHAQASEGDRKARLLEKVVEGLFPEFLKRDVERHLSLFPERYLRAAPPDAISRHFQMVQHLGGKPLVADWRSSPAGRYTVLTVCTRDAHGLLAHLAGTLTGHGLNILSVDAFTRSDGIVLDTFRVCETVGVTPVRPERWPAIESDLVAAVEGRHDVEAAVARSRSRAPRRGRRRPPMSPAVQFDSVQGGGPTVIEVRADDEPGLVYRIANTLTSLGLNIVLAKIATEKSHALDVFYVAAGSGAGLSQEAIPAVEEALLAALAPKPFPGS